MLRSRIDRAFERFRANGDPRHLARVFDATAPELYRLAWHLVGDRHAAEDLVQTTFVVAIQDAASFDSERGVLPWLCGVLANRALHLRRQLLMRATRAPCATADATVDPVVTATANELVEAVATKVRALPEPYRQVLLLHLLHELSPAEVAEALQRPGATVRTQIYRGLDLLRRALPVGIAAMANAGAPPPTLAAVRAAVLAKAGAVVTSGSAAIGTVGGALAMQKLAFGAAVVAVGCLVAWPLLRRSGPSTAVGAQSVAASQADGRRADESPLARPAPIEREAVPTTSSLRETALEVAVHWEGDGTPAADVVVTWRPDLADAELQSRSLPTDAAGIVRFAPLQPGSGALRIDRSSGTKEVDLAENQTTRTELRIPVGVTVHGRVLDPADRPIRGASIWLSAYGDHGEVVARSSEDGTFTLRDVAQRRRLVAWADGFAAAGRTLSGVPLSDSAIATAADVEGASAAHPDASGRRSVAGSMPEARASTEELVLRLRPVSGSIRGLVLDHAGNPIENAVVYVGWNQRGHHWEQDAGGLLAFPLREPRTDAQGRFVAVGLMPGKWEVWARAPGHAPWRQDLEVVAAAPTELTIRLQVGAAIAGRVTGVSGAPIEKAELELLHEQIEPDPNNYVGPDWARLRAESDGDGRFVLASSMPGQVRVRASVNRRPPNKVATAFQLVDGQQVTWNPVIGNGLLLQGVVVDPDGNPLAGWHAIADGLDCLTNTPTDREGRFRWEDAEDVEYEILVLDPAQDMDGAAARVAGVRPGSDPVRIEVPWNRIPSSRITGVVLGPDGEPALDSWLCLSLLRDDGVQESGGGALQIRDGRFESKPLFAGRYVVSVFRKDLGMLALGTWDLGRGAQVDVGRHRFAQAGSLVVDVLDARGESTRTPSLQIRRLDDADSAFGTDGDCNVWLQPGRYVVSSSFIGFMTCKEVEIAAGRATKVVFAPHGEVRCIVRVPPIPASDYWLRQTWRNAAGELVYENPGSLWGRSTKPYDLYGAIVPGRYTIEVRDASGRTATTTADIRDADPPVVVELPLPVHR